MRTMLAAVLIAAAVAGCTTTMTPQQQAAMAVIAHNNMVWQQQQNALTAQELRNLQTHTTPTRNCTSYIIGNTVQTTCY